MEKVSDYLKKGEKIKIKVLSISKDNKISLSIRQAKPKSTQPADIEWSKPDNIQKGMSFEDKMSKFLKDSNERHDQLKSRDNKRVNGMNGRNVGGNMD